MEIIYKREIQKKLHQAKQCDATSFFPFRFSPFPVPDGDPKMRRRGACAMETPKVDEFAHHSSSLHSHHQMRIQKANKMHRMLSSNWICSLVGFTLVFRFNGFDWELRMRIIRFPSQSKYGFALRLIDDFKRWLTRVTITMLPLHWRSVSESPSGTPRRVGDDDGRAGRTLQQKKYHYNYFKRFGCVYLLLKLKPIQIFKHIYNFHLWSIKSLKFINILFRLVTSKSIWK